MNLIGHPDALDSLAARLVRRAGDLDGVATVLQRRAETARWLGPRAERWRADRRRQHHEANVLADELRAASRELRAIAQRVRAELAYLHRLERLVRETVELATDVMVLPFDVFRLPATGDPSWVTYARDLGIA